jgi:hypothetical protein
MKGQILVAALSGLILTNVAEAQPSAAEIRRQAAQMREIQLRQMQSSQSGRSTSRSHHDIKRRHAEFVRKHKTEIDAYRKKELAREKAVRAAQAAFDPRTAPSPAKCLLRYIAAARDARSIQQFIKYLPVEEQHSLKNDQARHREAAERRKRSSGTMTKEQRERFNRSPYARALDWHKGIAEDFYGIEKVTIDGRNARVFVTTTNGAIVNGTRYPYGTGVFDLVGESGSWKIDKYNSGVTVYLYPPQPKK